MPVNQQPKKPFVEPKLIECVSLAEAAVVASAQTQPQLSGATS